MSGNNRKTRSEKVMLVLIESGVLYFLLAVSLYLLLTSIIVLTRVPAGVRCGRHQTSLRCRGSEIQPCLCRSDLDLHDEPHLGKRLLYSVPQKVVLMSLVHLRRVSTPPSW